MIAIFKTGGKQYCVKAGQILKVEKIEGKKGDNFTFNKILALGDKSKNTVGTPLIKGASIDAKILDQIRGEKIIVFKKRKRKNYRSTQGHRQYLTVLRIESINNDSEKKIITKDISNKATDLKTKTDEKKLKDKTKAKTKIEEKPITNKLTSKKTAKKKQVTKKTVAKKTTKSKK